MSTILVIEDTKSLRDVLVSMLENEGYKVLNAEDGKSGLTVALDAKPDLIFLDLLMPKMNGFDMIKELRSSGDWGKQAKVVIMTNVAPSTDVYNMLNDTEPMYYIEKKNWSLEEIKAKVKEILTAK